MSGRVRCERGPSRKWMSFLTVTTTQAKGQYCQIFGFVKLFSKESVKNLAREVRKGRGCSRAALGSGLFAFSLRKCKSRETPSYESAACLSAKLGGD